MPSETLVLMIEEIEDHNGVLVVDTRLFVFYDTMYDCYNVRGQRSGTTRVDYQPYAFRCRNLDAVADFIRFILCKQNQWCFTLYNYNNLSYYSGEITYDNLVLNQCVSKEIAGYDNSTFTRKELKNVLSLLMNVYNDYN